MALGKDTIRKKYSTMNDFMEAEKGKHQCNCGCNEIIELKNSHYWNGIPRFIFGHAARLRVGSCEYDKTRYYSVEDIAEIAQVSDQTVRLWNRHGKINASKTIGRKNLYAKSDIDHFLTDRPKRIPFQPGDYVTVQELKRMGVSRSKLRSLVRKGEIREPRHYARKTHYLREEISRYLDQILEDREPVRRKNKFPRAVIKKMNSKMKTLENRIRILEEKINKI